MQKVAIVGGCRTPFVKAAGVFNGLSFLDLGSHAVKNLVSRLNLDPGTIDELIYSTVLLDPRTPNAARELVFKSGLPRTLPAHFISNNCISGLVAATMGAEAIATGRVRTVVAGGSESMSRPTLTLRRKGEDFFLKLARARSLGERLAVMATFRPALLMPVPPSPKEPSTGLTMGEHCEITAKEFAIAREAQDQIALRSHVQAAKAQTVGVMAEEIAPLNGVDRDNLVRGDTSLEKLSALKPVFDRSGKGSLTAGNSSALTDGASAICLMSEAEAERQKREVLGFIEMVEYAAIDPNDGLLMAPGIALPRLLQRAGISADAIDLFEIHEAFAAQVLANMAVWEKGWSKHPEISPIGQLPLDKVNVNGGSIAIGHPFAATGGRLLLSLVNELKRRNKKLGVISVCAAGAMACAMLIRRP